MPDFAPLADAIYLTGPTAGGKTPIALELARRMDAEILSLDSMAVYRHMDIGTAKPTPEQRATTAHHLIDLVDPDEPFSLAQYVEAAHEAAAGAADRGSRPLLVGGTPLYLKSLLRGFFDGPPADWPLRRKLQAEAQAVGTAVLHTRLARIDPPTAARLHTNDTRRVIRALEVYAQTGQPISRLQQPFQTPRPAQACRVFVLQWSREALHARCDRRVEQMFAAGLVDETRHLIQRFRRLSRTARQAVGYRQVIDHLEDRHDLPETIRRVKTRTRQLVRRQETWFRSLSECRPVPMADDFDPARVAASILDTIDREDSSAATR